MQISTKTNYFLLAAIIVIYQVIGYTIGMVTRAGMAGWYDTLTKSPLTPPDYVFAMTWACLYVLLAIVTWRLIVLAPAQYLNQARIIFTAQMIANWAWSFMFFTAHWLFLSFIWIVALVSLNLGFVWLIWRIDRIGLYCMLPYIAWITFACYLAGHIWVVNPGSFS